MNKRFSIVFSIFVLCTFSLSQSQSLAPELKAKVDAKLQALQELGKDETVIKEVKALTAQPPLPGMTNDKWKTLTLLSPEVKQLTKNSLATYLKGKKDETMTELFVSDSAGNKVGFFSKTTSFCHKGKPKHDLPMTGKTWIGEVEIDESTGIKQVQISFPVLENKKPIGSIVVGLAVDKL